MCGIVGAWDVGEGARLLEHEIQAATDALAHRGPDDSGCWTEHHCGLVLGHRRLSVIDLTPAGHQPMVSRDGRWVLTYNGEVYNYREIARRLAAHGIDTSGSGDTAVILEAIAHWGIERTLEFANGMFAVAVWDRHERRLTIARDRFGQKPLHYGFAGARFLFASEQHALDALTPEPFAIDRQAVAGLVRYAYVPEPLSIRQGIRKLPPGGMLVISEGDVRRRQLPEPVRWWDAGEVALASRDTPFSKDRREAEEALRALLEDAVNLCTVSDAPLGAFLSGGVDSASVVTAMRATGVDEIRTFTIGFDEAGFDESPHAAALAQHLGARHTSLRVSADAALAVVPQLPRIYDEPFADSSQIATYLVSRLAREQVTVALSGDGGDELFGGYTRHVAAAGFAGRLGRMPLPVRRMTGAVINRLARHAGSDTRIAELARRAGLSIASEKLQKVARVLDAAGPRELYDRLTCMSAAPEVLLVPDLRCPARTALPALDRITIAEAMMLGDATGYLPNDILTKLDRASMAASLEARVPFLDHRLFAFAWSLPNAWKACEDGGKGILKRVLEPRVPPGWLDRPKSGFAIPVGEWLRGPLRDWAETLLAPDALDASVLDAGAVQRLWMDHVSGRANHHQQLWPILIYETWRRHYRDSIGTVPDRSRAVVR